MIPGDKDDPIRKDAHREEGGVGGREHGVKGPDGDPRTPKIDVEEAFKSAVSRFLGDPEGYSLDLDALDVRIYLKGNKWGGVVDKPLAKFLLDLDKVLAEELSRLGIDLPESDRGLIALRIEEGSLEAFLEYGKGILVEFRKMKPWQQIAILTTVLTAAGLLSATSIIEALNEDDLAKIQADENVRLVEAASQIREGERQLQKPLRGLVGSMQEGDTIQLPGSQEAQSKEEVKAQLPKATRSPVSTFKVDHRYIVQELSTKDPDAWQIGLSYGGVTFRAKLSITDEEANVLFKSFEEARARKSEIAPDLQVNAEINAKGVKSAQVIGLGDPRADSVPLGEALKKAEEKDPAPALVGEDG